MARWSNWIARLAAVVAATSGGVSTRSVLAAPPEVEKETAADQAKASALLPLQAWSTTGRWIESGLRIESRADGSIASSRLVFPSGGEAEGMSLPEHLGGGFVFYQTVAQGGATGTALWRGASWTGPLEPLGTLPFTVTEMRAGFDRLYALSGGAQAAVDLQTGKWLPLGPLPTVSTIDRLAFVGDRVAALQAPLVGVLVTRDAGATWHALPNALELTMQPGAVLRFDCAGSEPCRWLQRLAADGTLQPPLQVPTEAPPRDADRLLAERALVHGAPIAGGAVSLLEGRLVLLRRDGRLSRSAPVLDEATSCHGLPVTRSAGSDERAPNGDPAPRRTRAVLFFCDDGKVHAMDAPKAEAVRAIEASALRRVAAGRPKLLAAGEQGVLAQGACGAHAACLLTPAGIRPVEVARPVKRGSAFALAAEFDEQQVFVVEPARRSVKQEQGAPRQDAEDSADGGADEAQPIALTVRELGSGTVVTAIRAPEGRELRDLLLQGSLLPNAKRIRTSDGIVGTAFWMTWGSRFAGVFVSDEGKLRVGAVQRPLRRASFVGRQALLWGAAGFAKQSKDHGMTWQEFAFPFRSGDEAPTLKRPDQDKLLGCSAAGCLLGNWLRMGWGRVADDRELDVPASIAVPPPGGGRFRFVCTKTGERSDPSLDDAIASSRRFRRGLIADADELSPFWDVAPPALDGASLAVSIPAQGALAQFDVWGPEQGNWARSGQARILFRNPFEFDGVYSSTNTQGLFGSGLEVQESLGLLDRSTRFASVALDPGARAGVMLVRHRGDSQMFAFADGESVQRYERVEELQLRTLAGSVRTAGATYVGSALRELFRVVRLSGGRAELVADFPLSESGARSARLIRSTNDGLGIVLEGDRGLVIHPLSTEGQLGAALLVPHRGSAPEACAPEASGFLFDHELSISPFIEDGTGRLDVDDVQLRLIAGYGPPCVASMAAEVRRELQASSEPVDGADIPFVVSNLGEGGRRQLLSCR